MTSYIIRRVLVTIPILLVVVTIVFLGIRLAPGNPAVAMLGGRASQQAIVRITKKLGLDRPLWVQYWDYMSGLFHGDLGDSLATGKTVSSQVARAFPYSLSITLEGLLMGLMIGIPLGVITGIYRNEFFDYIGRVVSLAGMSVPSYYLGTLLILYLSLKLNFFPVLGGGEITRPLDFLYRSFLPALSLGLLMAAYMTRVARNSFLEIIGKEYINTARSKGLRESRVIFKHTLRNSLIPVVTLTGLYVGILVGNCVLIEQVFTRPGLGKLLIGAIRQRDYTMMQSVMLIYAAFIAFANLFTDMAYGFIDPRITYD